MLKMAALGILRFTGQSWTRTFTPHIANQQAPGDVVKTLIANQQAPGGVVKASLSGSVIDTVIKTGNLRTVSVECHGDDTPLTFHDTLLSSLLILLVHISKFNIHDTPITLLLRLTLEQIIIFNFINNFPNTTANYSTSWIIVLCY